MIEDPPILTLCRTFNRPTPEQIGAIRDTPTGFLCDALGGRAALSGSIKPVGNVTAAFCGSALPCHTGPADNLAAFAALDLAQPGDVIVIATDGFTGTAVIGDLLLGMARNCGAVAVVTDGYVRDVPGIEAAGIPCFAAGVTPNSPARNGPGTAGLPVTLAGASVSPGDIVAGDQDGVVVIPHDKIDEVIKALPGIRTAEADLDARVNDGLTVPEFARKMLNSNRVREI